MKLDARLKAVINEIDGVCLADIGCDHCKVGAQALLSHKVDRVIASDISLLSLQKGEKLFKELNIFDKADFRCGDGFEYILDNEADVVVIAGMGGQEIIKILSNKKLLGVKKYIFVAHTDVILLRKYLIKNGYGIDKDYIVKDSHFYYSIITSINKETQYNMEKMLFGNSDKTNNDYIEYLKYIIDRNQKLLKNNLPQEKKDMYLEQIRIAEVLLDE